MQTFLPYPNFKKSAEILDYRRLGKQRVEALQILKAVQNENYGWKSHPIVKMWKGFESALIEYKNTMIHEWISRGYNNNMMLDAVSEQIVYPPWLGIKEFHASHRSNLLNKDLEYYSQFNWKEKPGMDYIWFTSKDNK